jgi:hypothetical protein
MELNHYDLNYAQFQSEILIEVIPSLKLMIVYGNPDLGYLTCCELDFLWSEREESAVCISTIIASVLPNFSKRPKVCLKSGKLSGISACKLSSPHLTFLETRKDSSHEQAIFGYLLIR